LANLSQMSDPVAVQRDITNGVGNGTDDFRLALGGLGQPPPAGSVFGFGSGIFPTTTTNGTITDCQVTANTPTANMGALVNFGNYQIQRSYRGIFLGSITAPVPITFSAANASNPRIDYVVIRIRSSDVDISPPERTADIVILEGTPAPSPVEPTAQLTEGDFLLAAVTIRAGTTQVLTGDIAGRRVYAAARGGVYPATSVDTRSGGFPGQMRYNTTSSAYEGWEAVSGQWVPITSLTQWSSFAPAMYYQPPATAVDFSKVCNLGSGNAISCRYQRVGKTLTLNYIFDWGNTPYDMGWGAIFTILPAGMFAKQETHLKAKLFVARSSNTHWQGNCYILSASNIMYPQFPISSTDGRLGNYQVSSTSAKNSGTGIPFISGSWPDAGILNISGVMEIQ
jgi:hypothetical protein